MADWIYNKFLAEVVSVYPLLDCVNCCVCDWSRNIVCLSDSASFCHFGLDWNIVCLGGFCRLLSVFQYEKKASKKTEKHLNPTNKANNVDP